jgi:hypothetical protein
LVRLSNLDDLRAQSKSKRAAHPEGENELYRRWQVGQYSQTMFTTHYDEIDNDRYPDLKWTSFADLGCAAFLNGRQKKQNIPMNTHNTVLNNAPRAVA